MAHTQASCWCSARQTQTTIEGELEGKRAVEILEVTGCVQKNCPQLLSRNCLVGKNIEAHWL